MFWAFQNMDRETACFPHIPYFRSELTEIFCINVLWFDPLEKWASWAVQKFIQETSTI